MVMYLKSGVETAHLVRPILVATSRWMRTRYVPLHSIRPVVTAVIMEAVATAMVEAAVVAAAAVVEAAAHSKGDKEI
jgi:hypothetical protein